MFAALGMFNSALRGPMTSDDIADLERHLGTKSLWVADVDDTVAGYVMLGEVDGKAHLDQVTVDPAYGRRALGRVLIEHSVAVARVRGFPAMTLTTYAEVPWNAPYYARLGFRELRPEALTEGLVAIRQRERAAGLDEWPRVVMIRPL
jgi:ribosomal protein S18 acetylase RimI-like enzyme